MLLSTVSNKNKIVFTKSIFIQQVKLTPKDINPFRAKTQYLLKILTSTKSNELKRL